MILLPPLMALISFWHGGHGPEAPKSLKNLIWALPFGLVFISISYQYPVICLYETPLVIAMCMLKGLGQGRGFRLHEPMEEGSTPEKVEWLLKPLYGKIPLYWYKVLIMVLVGLGAVSGGLIFAEINPWYAVIILLSGALKGVNAMIFDKRTEYRELMDGFVVGLALMVVLWAH